MNDPQRFPPENESISDEERLLRARMEQAHEAAFVGFVDQVESAIKSGIPTHDLEWQALHNFGQPGIDVLRALKWLNEVSPAQEAIEQRGRPEPARTAEPSHPSWMPPGPVRVIGDLVLARDSRALSKRTARSGWGWSARRTLIGAGLCAGLASVLLIFAFPLLKLKTPHGTLVVEVNEPDAVVEVLNEKNEVEITRSNAGGMLSISVDPGNHRLKVVKDGFSFYAQDFEMASGGSKTIRATLTPLDAPAVVLDAQAAAPARQVQRDDAWLKTLTSLPAKKQVDAVTEKLRELNPGFDGRVTHVIDKSIDRYGVVTELKFSGNNVSDISPVRGLLRLRRLVCSSTPGKGLFTDLSPLRDVPFLEHLDCSGTQVSDLSPLHGLRQLRELFVQDTLVSDLSPLEGLKLTALRCDSTNVSDLAPLKGMRLTSLNCPNTSVSDLSPLAGMRLTALSCFRTQVSDLMPLKGMPLNSLSLEATQVSDLSPLQGVPLATLNVAKTAVKDLTPLQEMTLTALDCHDTRIRDLAPLKGMPLTILHCYNTQVSDLTPLKGMRLTSLKCLNTLVSDLSPLADMRLTLLYCNKTQVSDLTPLKGMPLITLDCRETQVTDLTALKEMPLETLDCDFRPERDTEILASIKTLKKIQGKPAEVFWKEVQAQQAVQKP